MKYQVIFTDVTGVEEVHTEHKTLRDAQKELSLQISAFRDMRGGKVDKTGENKYTLSLRNDPHVIEHWEIRKVSANRMTNQLSINFETPNTRSIVNNNNQPKTSKTMAKTTLQKVAYNKNKRDKFNRVVGNPYQYKANGVMYQAVPETMVTLKPGNSFIVARKHLNLVDQKTGKSKGMATYVLGYSNLSGKTQSGHQRRSYWVARQIFRGGRPALAIYSYKGYNQALAKQVFSEIPYSEAWYRDKNNNFQPYRKTSMSSEQIVQRRIKLQKSKETLKTKAYGSKEKRQAYAKAHPNKYPRVK